jgi:L-malate glycosyltransferase
MTYPLLNFKRKLEQLLMLPFVLYGKHLAKSANIGSYDLVFFFNCFDIGGGEKVNADIINCVKDKSVLIFYSRKSKNGGMQHYFSAPNITAIDLSEETDNKFIYWRNVIRRGYCAAIVNRMSSNPVVFISQCNFGYKTLPYLSKALHITELIHMYNRKFANVWVPFVQFIGKRVVLNNTVLQQFALAYKQFNIPITHVSKIEIISNMVDTAIARQNDGKKFELPLRIYYAGRGGAQKRLWIWMQIARQCIQENVPVSFTIAGPVKNEIPDDLISKIHFLGELNGSEAVNKLYENADILLMTSDWEGYPLVIMESSLHGNFPITTNVGGIGDHITHGVNGLLVNSQTEKEIIDDSLKQIRWCVENTSTLSTISENAKKYTVQTFSQEKFRAKYRKLFNLN